jgi:mRNA-degrading endonuclease RelE of RelBE toxin-antitoxin system
MGSNSPFTLIFSPEVVNHLRFIERKYHALIKETIREQLRYTPSLRTRNRKLLRQPTQFGATWEIRFGPGNQFRVFYDVDETEKLVIILAIGIKTGNRLVVADEEFKP